MPGKKSRQKGQRGEREGASALSTALGIKLSRGVQFKGTPDSPDIAGMTDIGLHPEVKRDESTLSLATYKAINQAVSDSGSNIPFVLSRRNRSDWLIVLRLDDLDNFCRSVTNRHELSNNQKKK